MLGETRSTTELMIRIEPMDFGDGEKHWVRVYLTNGKDNFVSSFEELFHIIQLICLCEDRKYPMPYQLGGDMVQDFLRDCCEPGITWEELRKDYQVPDRNSCMGKR